MRFIAREDWKSDLLTRLVDRTNMCTNMCTSLLDFHVQLRASVRMKDGEKVQWLIEQKGQATIHEMTGRSCCR